MLQLFGFASGFVSILSFLPYLKDILHGKTKPERASWIIWMALGSIAFFSQLAKGATDSLWMTGVQSLGTIVIFLLAIRFGIGGLARRDIVALVIAACGLVLWYVTKEAAIALVIVICLDSVASFLTVLKSYEDPASETLSSWILFSLSGIFGMLAVGEWNVILLAYPCYVFVANAAVVSALYMGKRSLSKKVKHTNAKRD